MVHTTCETESVLAPESSATQTLGDSVEGFPLDSVRRLLRYVGEDPNRDGLRETPQRVLRALQEMTAGYHADIASILGKRFDVAHDQMVTLTHIGFTSLCEHHILPFEGEAAVAYIPSGFVVGISKLARVVEAFARRLQVQERMTDQIAEAIQQHLRPRGVAVIVEARHGCMRCRGVRQQNTCMVTSAMLGAFRERPEARAEFLALWKTGG